MSLLLNQPLYYMYIALSPAYAIRNEASASFLIRVDKIVNLKRSEFSAFCIPPFIGYILSHIGNLEYSESVKAISNTLKISASAIDKFIQQLIENKENKEFLLSKTQSIVFPSELLIQYSDKPNPNVYEENSFNGLGEFVIKRPSVPLSANLMVTTNCSTDCVYCYANRKLRPLLKTDKLLDLIKELHDEGVVNLTLTGGDVFVHPDWATILECVRQYGYKPFLSTKTPLTYEQIQYLRDLGYEEIQFSLDSVDNDVLKSLINVKNGYLDKVSSFLNHCTELGINVLIRSVLTKLNASKDNVLSLYEFLSDFDCVKEWVMTPAFFSKYKESEYKHLEAKNEDLISIYEFTKQSNFAFKIGLNKITDKGYILKRFKTIEEYVCHNQICMANTTCISILANGDCSVCEMLYDNPEYILGNVSKSSIREIWNSEKALQLYTMKQSHFPQSSPCLKCSVFDKCRNDFGKRVCYLDIAKLGYSKWNPDPRCPHADNVNIVL